MNSVLDELQRSTAAEIQKRITSVISRRCMESLKLVRNITSQYRHTNKKPPTEASSFIPKLFLPFTEFIEENNEWISQEKRQAWGVMVADAVLSR